MLTPTVTSSGNFVRPFSGSDQDSKEFYAAGFQGLVKRWDKCLNAQGNKSIFQISTLVCLSSISICNLLIDLPLYDVNFTLIFLVSELLLLYDVTVRNS
jgi:hypothetical protein